MSGERHIDFRAVRRGSRGVRDFGKRPVEKPDDAELFGANEPFVFLFRRGFRRDGDGFQIGDGTPDKRILREILRRRAKWSQVAGEPAAEIRRDWG